MANPTRRIYERMGDVQARLAESSAHSVASLYHEQSKRWPRSLSLPFAAVANDLLSDFSRSAFKEYRLSPRIPLLEPQALPIPLDELILRRRTVRAFTGQAVTREQISTLLALSYRILQPAALVTPSRQMPKRPVPSGGALYPLELYLAIVSADPLKPGLYHYHPALHALEVLSLEEPKTTLKQSLMPSSLPEGTALVFSICGVLPRNRFRYGELGYRLMLLEAGHLAQNILLVAEALGLGAVPCCGFYDDQMHDYLEVDGVDEICLYLLLVGQPNHQAVGTNE